MSLKQKIIDAKVQALQDTGVQESIDTGPGTYIEREAQYIAEAVLETLTEANFTITQLKAPVILESMKTPEQPVNIELETLLGEYQPVLKLLKKLGDPLGLGALIDKLEGEIEKAILPLLEGGAKLAKLDLGKDDGGLESTGYVYIGEDPDSQAAFDVEDEDGQREFTTVKLLHEDADELM
jgi:hypothetical protein